MNPNTKDLSSGLDAGEAVDVWEWLTGQTNLSLDYDWTDEGEDGAWRVHRITGNTNDREWDLVGVGATPLMAVIAARAKVSPPMILEPSVVGE